MSDLELLELAARAAGYEVDFDTAAGVLDYYAHGYDEEGDVEEWWNPLLSDGDALRLASTLELDVLHRVVGGSRVEVLPAGGPLIQEFYGHPSDRLVATRRAIVKAAAKARRSAPAHPGEGKGD